MRPTPGPEVPRVVEFLLSSFVPPGDREAYLGDVAELYTERRRRGSTTAAVSWLVQELAASGGRWCAGASRRAARETSHGLLRAVLGMGIAWGLLAVANSPPALEALRGLGPESRWEAVIGVNGSILLMAAWVAGLGPRPGRLAGALVFTALILLYPLISALASGGAADAAYALQVWRPAGWWIGLVVGCSACGTLVAGRQGFLGARANEAATVH